jgi:hypothetical protein
MEEWEMGKAVRRFSVFALLAVAFAFAFVPVAEAARQTFGPISVVVPSGWQVTEEETQLTFTAPDNAAVVSIIIDELEGYTLKDIAEGVAGELNGSAPVADADGDFSFTFQNEHGVDAVAVVTGGIEGFFMLWLLVGEHPDMQSLLGSIQDTQ